MRGGSRWAGPRSPRRSPHKPRHPAVVRVTAIERNGASLGSGVLVAVSQNYGLVITNWHVVRDASGPILVSFPDGFGSGATLLKTDRTWDLAALAISRPRVGPVMISTEPARPGDVLTIAGYGRDWYRAISGRCTEYLSPGDNNPNEIVELDVAARQGDSGGPIFNARGELAGVLFGSNDSFFAGQYTMGSYCGRVRRFLVSASVDFERLPVSSALLARQMPAAAQPAPAAAIIAREVTAGGPDSSAIGMPKAQEGAVGTTAGLSNSASPSYPLASNVSPAYPSCTAGQAGHHACMVDGTQLLASNSSTTYPVARAAGPVLPDVPNRFEQIKTLLAAIGVFAVLFHVIRLIGAAAG